MSDIDRILIAVNMLWALAAFFLNVIGSKYVYIHLMRYVFFAVSVLAMFYAVAYVILLLDPGINQEWTSFMRGFSVIAWVVTWCGPAVALIVTRRQRERFINALIEASRDNPELESVARIIER